MNPSALSVLLLLAGVLWADPVWHVEYPKSFCVVKGSTTTIPCSFTYPVFPNQPGGLPGVNRVVWCINHGLCQGNTPSVYDSNKTNDNRRFVYLGDYARNCTLQISNTTDKDQAEYRFRIETKVDTFTGPLGVQITVMKGEDVEVRSSISENVVREGGQVTLNCTADCSFHQLDVNWYRNDHPLKETGPVLHLRDLTIGNTGNYTCSLDPSMKKRSLPCSLLVEADERKGFLLIVGVVMGILLPVFSLLLVGFVIAKRRHAPKKAAEVIPKQEVDSKQEVMAAPEEISYAAFHFKHNSSRPDHVQDDVVYSKVTHSTNPKH